MKMPNILFLVPISEIGSLKLLLFIAKDSVRKGAHPCLITQEPGPLTEEFLKLGGKVFILKLPAWRKGRNFFRRYFTIFKIAKIIRENKVGLVHCFSWRLTPYALYAARQCRIPAISHVHDFLDRRHIFRFLVHKARYLIVPSEYVGKCFTGLRPRVFKVPNGIEVETFASGKKGKIRAEFKVANNTILVGMIGYFTPWKGQDFFIRSLSYVKKELPNVKFMIVGDNIWNTAVTRETLQKLAREEGVLEDIIFSGARNDLPDILADLDIFALPSKNESFGMSIIEAMSAGLPVIAHKFSGGPSEIIEDGINGLLVDACQPQELAHAIIRLIREPELNNRLAEAGLVKVRQNFTLAHFLGDIEKVYQDVQENSDY